MQYRLDKTQRQALSPAAREMLSPENLPLEEQRLPMRVALVVFLVLAVLSALIFFASRTYIDEYVSADGFLTTATPPLPIRPYQTAVLKELTKRPGDVVEKGELLAVFDDTSDRADVARYTTQLNQLTALRRRLLAEALLKGTRIVDPLEKETLRHQFGNFAAEEQAFVDRRAAAHKQLVDSESQLFIARNLVEQNATTEEAFRKLYGQGYVSRLQVIQAVGTREQLQANYLKLQSDRDSLVQQDQQIATDEATFRTKWSGDLDERVINVDQQIASVSGDLRKAQQLQSIVNLHSPVDGAVVSVSQQSPGSAVQGTEPLMTIAPLNSPLEAVLKVKERDIADITSGDRVRLKLNAFSFERYGTLAGIIRVLSPDVTSQAQVGLAQDPHPSSATDATYDVYVQLMSNNLHGIERPLNVLPGMALRGDITVGKRSLLSYFIAPLRRITENALHEAR